MILIKKTDRSRSHRVLALASIVLIALGLLTACGGAGDGDDSTTAPAESTKSADLVYVNWAEGVAYTHLAKVVLEDKLGYEVEITAADVGPAYVAVAQGDKDAFMETWLPVLHKDYIDKYRDSVIDLGHVYENTQSGLVVPTYVTIDTISELDAHADKFDGKITGIDAGAGIMKTTAQVIEDYGLGLELMSSSGPAMAAALQEAVANEEWIVVTGWRPHWMFGRWDLKFLEQDKDKTIWGTGNIHIMGRKGLREDKPELAAFLSNMYLTDPQLADLMLKIKESDEDIETVARAWMAENEDVISDWMPSGA